MEISRKPHLSNTLRLLHEVGARLGPDFGREETAQEILDVLALRAGLKPVLLLGRGLDDARWVAGAVAVARDLGLRTVEGPYWDATPFGDGFPAWYVERTRAALAPYRACYVCRDEATEHAIDAVHQSGGRLTAEEEARLLGYPPCCVAAHYERALAFHRATLSILGRHGAGDAARMAALFESASRLPAETPAERADLAAAATVIPAPYGSWNMCENCARDENGPSAELSRRYAGLARTLDAEWAAGFAASAAPPPDWTP